MNNPEKPSAGEGPFKMIDEFLKQNGINKESLIVGNVGDVIGLHDPETAAYLYTSPSCKSVVGYEPSELLGKSTYDFVHPDSLEKLKLDHEKKKTSDDGPVKPPEKWEMQFLHKDGHYIWLESYSKPLFNERGELLCILSSNRDIAERKRAEELQREKSDIQQTVMAMSMFVNMKQSKLQELTLELEKMEYLGYHKELPNLHNAVVQLTQKDTTERTYKMNFKENYPDYYDVIKGEFPELTPSEIALFAMIRTGLSKKEILSIKNISQESLRSVKSRALRKIKDSNRDPSGLIAAEFSGL